MYQCSSTLDHIIKDIKNFDKSTNNARIKNYRCANIPVRRYPDQESAYLSTVLLIEGYVE